MTGYSPGVRACGGRIEHAVEESDGRKLTSEDVTLRGSSSAHAECARNRPADTRRAATSSRDCEECR